MRYENNISDPFSFAGPAIDSASIGESDKNKNITNSQSTRAATEVWGIVASHLKSEIDPQILEAYISPLVPVCLESELGELTLASNSRFLIEKVEHAYSSRIKEALLNQSGGKINSVVFKHDPSLPKDKIIERQAMVGRGDGQLKTTVIKQSGSTFVAGHHLAKDSSDVRVKEQENAPVIPTNLNSKYTFSNFIVGNSNQFCNAAARQVADEPGCSYNPLFIYGGVGLGKTHLLHAIGNAALEKNPAAKVIYMSSETFTNELIHALRNGKMDDFKKRLRDCDVLLIDDIQFISGKERTQEEFFHTFNTLYSAKRQIVITSDSTPQEIEGLKERLQTRFSWGLIADLQSPDFETRVAILNRKAALDRFYLPMEVAHYIAENISTNVRELEGALTRLSAVCSLQGVAVSKTLAESVLKPMIKSKSVNITVDDIKRVVATHFGLKVSDLSSKKRSRSFSFPRHIAMYLCRKHTTCSYPDIGNQFGGRDHSSVIHAANVVGKKLKAEAEVRAIVDKIQDILMS